MEEKNNNSFRQDGNQVIHTRMLNAPRELVWDVWTKPEHIKEWWGPVGFTLTNKSMTVKKGSEWRFTMHGFGKDFENKIEYLEVVRPSLLSYRHGDENDTISFTVYITFEELGTKTRLTMRSVFKSEEFLNELNRQVNAIEGGKQTLDKLEAYLKTQLQLQN
jgi:uncharacterized protein YndB with AHSA1/START domain